MNRAQRRRAERGSGSIAPASRSVSQPSPVRAKSKAAVSEAARHDATGLRDRDWGYPTDWRDRLSSVARRRVALAEEELQIVDEALRAGATWAAIGSVLGVTRQSAFQRLASKVERKREAQGGGREGNP